MDNTDLTSNTDTLDLSNSLMEEEGMATKFYNNDSICLYACLDPDEARKIIQTGSLQGIKMPIVMYESEYAAKLLPRVSGSNILMVFAVNVSNKLCDELELSLPEHIRKNKGVTIEQIRKSAKVVRKLDTYVDNQGDKKKRAYIKYIIQDSSAILNAFPMKSN